eukprot:11046066-Alexandrium_andersonii.AAC.1
MSASLVGSEMCIRDSLSRVWNPPNTWRAPIATPCFGATALRMAPPQSGACLLYTSDAADDM